MVKLGPGLLQGQAAPQGFPLGSKDLLFRPFRNRSRLHTLHYETATPHPWPPKGIPKASGLPTCLPGTWGSRGSAGASGPKERSCGGDGVWIPTSRREGFLEGRLGTVPAEAWVMLVLQGRHQGSGRELGQDGGQGCRGQAECSQGIQSCPKSDKLSRSP